MKEYEKLAGASHKPARNILRVIGPMFILVGGICLLVAVVDFFLVFGGSEMPKLFWLAFVGIPVLGLGFTMTSFGFMDTLLRYQASEVAPVASDTVNYMGKSTRPGVKSFTSAISEGLAEGVRTAKAATFDSNEITCPQCDAENQAGSKFCDQCGSSLADIVCSKCGASNGLGSKFCDQCGHELN